MFKSLYINSDLFILYKYISGFCAILLLTKNYFYFFYANILTPKKPCDILKEPFKACFFLMGGFDAHPREIVPRVLCCVSDTQHPYRVRAGRRDAKTPSRYGEQVTANRFLLMEVLKI